MRTGLVVRVVFIRSRRPIHTVDCSDEGSRDRRRVAENRTRRRVRRLPHGRNGRSARGSSVPLRQLAFVLCHPPLKFFALRTPIATDPFLEDLELLIQVLREVFHPFRVHLALDELLHREEVVREDLGHHGVELVVVLANLEREIRNLDEFVLEMRRELVLDDPRFCMLERTTVRPHSRAVLEAAT